MEFVGIARKNKIKNVHRQKISLLVQIHGYFRRIYTELLEHKGAYANLHQQADHCRWIFLLGSAIISQSPITTSLTSKWQIAWLTQRPDIDVFSFWSSVYLQFSSLEASVWKMTKWCSSKVRFSFEERIYCWLVVLLLLIKIWKTNVEIIYSNNLNFTKP